MCRCCCCGCCYFILIGLLPVCSFYYCFRASINAYPHPYVRNWQRVCVCVCTAHIIPLHISPLLCSVHSTHIIHWVYYAWKFDLCVCVHGPCVRTPITLHRVVQHFICSSIVFFSFSFSMFCLSVIAVVFVLSFFLCNILVPGSAIIVMDFIILYFVID